MDGKYWLKYLRERRPQYAIKYKSTLDRFANKGHSKSDYSQFGPIYQIFMYAFMIGFHQRERIPLPKSPDERVTFLEIGKWQPTETVDAVLMTLLAHDPIRQELDLNFIRMEEMEEDEVREKFKGLIRIMEEHANAGLAIVEERFEVDRYFFQDPFAFMRLLKEVADGMYQ
ncbi:hypothetical protein [Roseivirga pacifica]|jgi:hypothetical protein